MKRWPAASGERMARMCRSARSRTSTISSAIRGLAGTRPFMSRSMMSVEPLLAVLTIGPNTAPGRIVVSVIGPS